MSDAIRGDEPLSERLTWKQICERYPDEWVVLVGASWVNDTDSEFGTATSPVGYASRRRSLVAASLALARAASEDSAVARTTPRRRRGRAMGLPKKRTSTSGVA